MSFASGVASARNSSTPASAAMAAAVSGLSPVIMTVLIPMPPQLRNRSLIPPLTISLSCIAPSTLAPSATTKGVPPCLAIMSTLARTSGGNFPPRRRDICIDGIRGALADLAAVQV